jgi:serine/threonine protein kinase
MMLDLYDHPKRSINSKGKRRKPGTITFSESLKRSDYETSDNDFVDFMSKCLTWEPSKRITPIEALNHPWLRTTKKTASSTTS